MCLGQIRHACPGESFFIRSTITVLTTTATKDGDGKDPEDFHPAHHVAILNILGGFRGSIIDSLETLSELEILINVIPTQWSTNGLCSNNYYTDAIPLACAAPFVKKQILSHT